MHTRTVALVLLSLVACGPSPGDGSGDADSDGDDAAQEIAACEQVSACVTTTCPLSDLPRPLYWEDYDRVLACAGECGAPDHRSQYRAVFDSWGATACDEPAIPMAADASCETVAACVRQYCPLSLYYPEGALSDLEYIYGVECAGECGAPDRDAQTTAVSVGWGIRSCPYD